MPFKGLSLWWSKEFRVEQSPMRIATIGSSFPFGKFVAIAYLDICPQLNR
ncbi:hypothetical protein [Coleofasciculus sp. FACHB-129]|nr:hypothetical protein [Coleofasciculus sp. FACHB-129]MBD1893818.1 hypothetical protein [Coleofasciculus sp. FACHB-129]